MNAKSKKAEAQTSFTMQRLRRQALWGSAAAAALLLAILAGRTDIGSQRTATVLASLSPPSPPSARLVQSAAQIQAVPRAPEPDSATRQLAQAVRTLADDRDRMATRLAAVEHNIDDMTGSITRQIEAAKTAPTRPAPPPWPDSGPPVLMIPSTIASVAAAAAPPPPAIPTPAPSPQAAAAAPAPEIVAPDPPVAYGADIGGGLSIKALRARWAVVASAHPEIITGLTPVVALKDNPRSNKMSMRLMLGPFSNAERAAEVCASFAAVRIACQPTMFDGEHLALQ